jgi:3-oxoacyl-[acyl-carrier protein] reductase
MPVDHKVALVTGASRGIGKAIALKLGRDPELNIIGSATSEKGAVEITDYLKAAKIKGEGIVLDIGEPTSIKSALEKLTNSIGMPSILVNNAGITADNLFIRMDIEEWSKVIDVNLTGTYRLIHACIRSMMKQRFGRIVNMSSVVGATGNPGQANYAASKAGIIGLTKSLARELGSRGITLNVVSPGFIDTDMTRLLSEEQHAKLLEQIPMGRMGQPEEVANVVAFLVSEEAAYITGETLHVNGGMYMC